MKRLSLLALCVTASAARAEPISLTAEHHAVAPLAYSFVVTLSEPASVELVCDSVVGRPERHRLDSPTGPSHSLTIFGLKPDTRYRCIAFTSGERKRASQPLELRTEPLPVDLVPPVIEVRSVDPRHTGYSVFNYASMSYNYYYPVNYLLVIDPWGNVRWYLEGVGGGDVDVSYLGDATFLYGGKGNFAAPPTVVNLEGQAQTVQQPGAASTWEDPDSTNHDAGLSSTGASILSLTFEQVNDGEWRGFLIRETEMASGRLLWKWSSVDDGVSRGYLKSGAAQGKVDPYHANAVIDTIEDGHRYVYVSLRNESQILKIDYATRAVVWKLGVGGDFTLLENDGTPASDSARWFQLPHDFKRRGNLLSFYDNGVGRSQSRALQLEIDEEAMTVRIVFEYTEPDWYEPFWGGYDLREDGTSLLAIGHSWISAPDVYPSALVELDPDGQVSWRAEMPSPQYMLYRAEHIPGCALFSNVALCPPDLASDAREVGHAGRPSPFSPPSGRMKRSRPR